MTTTSANENKPKPGNIILALGLVIFWGADWLSAAFNVRH